MSLARSKSLLGLIFVFAQVAICFGPPGPSAALTQAADKTASDAQAADPAAASPISDKAFQLRYDLSARASELGEGKPDEHDLAKRAFEFVRNHVRFEVYRGLLRGPEITYASRAGNALDRAALLAELLENNGVETRFAFGRLPAAECERLFARIFESLPGPEDERDKSVVATPAKSEFLERVRARAAFDLDVVRGALGDKLPKEAGPTRDDTLGELAEHCWVQAKIAGKWVDLDSALADAEVGQQFCKPTSTAPAIPPAMQQTVTIRLVVESLQGKELKKEKVLEVKRPAVMLIDRQVFFTHAPDAGLEGAISSAVLGSDAWRPVLWIDGEYFVADKSVSFADVEGRRGGPPQGGLKGVFGSGGALAGERRFVAEWLEFELSIPGTASEKVARALVDRAGAAWRASKSPDAAALRPLTRDKQGLAAPRELHNIWFSAGQHNLAAYAEAVSQWDSSAVRRAAATADKAKPTEGDAPEFAEQVWPLALSNFSLVLRSDQVVVPALNDTDECRFYFDSPRIVIVTHGLAAIDKKQPPQPFIQFDLRRDRLRGIARQQGAARNLVERKIWFGILEGALEHEAAADFASSLDPKHAQVASTSGLLSDRDQSVAVFFSREEAAKQLAKRPELAARIATATDQGAVVVVPRRVLEGSGAGWWEIAAGGDTRAVWADDLNAGTGFMPRGPLGFPVEKGYRPTVNPGRRGVSPPSHAGATPQSPPPGGSGVVPRDPPPGGTARAPRPGPGGATPRDPLPGGGARSPGPGPKGPGGFGPGGGGRGGGGGGAGGGGSREAKKKKGGGNEYIAIIDVVAVGIIGTVALYGTSETFQAGVNGLITDCVQALVDGRNAVRNAANNASDRLNNPFRFPQRR